MRCNGAEEGGLKKAEGGQRKVEGGRWKAEGGKSSNRKTGQNNSPSTLHPSPSTKKSTQKSFQKSEWMQFLNPDGMRAKGEKRQSNRDLRGEEPDFSEEGWAIRKPRKKK